MREFDLHQFHVLCASGIVYPKHSLPDILPMEHGKPCDIACIGTLLVIFQVIHLNIIAYTNCLCDLQSISPPIPCPRAAQARIAQARLDMGSYSVRPTYSRSLYSRSCHAAGHN